MDKRKVVKSGNSSFTIALPINWIRKNKIEKGSVVNVSENEVGEIVIFSDIKPDSLRSSVITIKIDNKDFESVSLGLLNAYFRDFKTIILEGKETGKIYDKILIQVKSYIGLDIIEQSKNNIVIKNFSTDDEELSPRPLIKKVDFGIREMFDLLKGFFKSGFFKDNYFELQKIREQNDRIYALTKKTILKAIEYPMLIRAYQTSFIQISKDKGILNLLNQISFILDSIGKSLLYLDYKNKDIFLLKKIFESAEKDYRTIINAMKYKNYKDVFHTITLHKKNIAEIEYYRKDLKNQLMLESITYFVVLMDILKNLAFEIIE